MVQDRAVLTMAAEYLRNGARYRHSYSEIVSNRDIHMLYS